MCRPHHHAPHLLAPLCQFIASGCRERRPAADTRRIRSPVPATSPGMRTAHRSGGSMASPQPAPGTTHSAESEALPLSALEVTYVMAVLQGAIDKLALIGVLNVNPRAQAQELTQSVGENIGHMIDEQKQLERAFQELISQQPGLRLLANKAKLHENQAQLHQVSEALKHATKQLCRNLKDNPNVSENLAKIAAQRQMLQNLLTACSTELHNRHTILPVIKVLLAAEQEELGRQEVHEAEHEATSAVRGLKASLQDEKVHHEEQMAQQRRDMAALKQDLRTDKLSLAIQARHQEKDLLAGNACARRTQHSTLDVLEQQLALLRQQIEIERSVQAAGSQFLSQRTEELQERTAGWQARQDDDLRAKDRDIDVLQAQQAHAAERLAEVQGRLQEELNAQASRAAKAAEAAAAERAAAVEAEMKFRATMVIQAHWRGYKARQQQKGGGKKGGGKPAAKGKKKK